jgi:subtilisin family serine protease
VVTINMLAVATFAPPANGWDTANSRNAQLLLRVPAGQLDDLLSQYGLTLAASIEGRNLHLVEAPEGMDAEQLALLLDDEPSVQAIESVHLASLPGIDTHPDPGEAQGDLLQTGTRTDTCWTGGPDLWSGFVDQGAGEVIGLTDAHSLSTRCGQGITVAVLDTGVDPNHPLLADALVEGYDFFYEEIGKPSEYRLVAPHQSLTTVVEQSLTTVVEQSLTTVVEADTVAVLAGHGQAFLLDQGIAPILAPESVSTLEGLSLPPYFGHGSMVAGLVRWTAPAAQIMPLRVFDGEGQGHLFNIVRAIYWAVDHGADIINMSFTFPSHSRELQEAVQYARQNGVVCVVAAGNQGEHTLVYPAAYADTVGVASTTLDDQLSPFSNHGSQLVTLAAPGSAVISAYPGEHYAAGWGTSFSSPLVAGTLALIFDAVENGSEISSFQQRVNHLRSGSVPLQDLAGLIGAGRLDMLATLATAP